MLSSGPYLGHALFRDVAAERPKPSIQPARSLRHVGLGGSNPLATHDSALTAQLSDLRFLVGTALATDGADVPAEEFDEMFPVIFLDHMAGAAEVILALFAILAAGLNFVFSARA